MGLLKKQLLRKRLRMRGMKKQLVLGKNPMLEEYEALRTTWPADMARLLDSSLEAERRSVLWETMVEGCDRLRKKYAWALPDERALGVLKHVAPVCELGAGRGYWCSLLLNSGASAIAYDCAPPVKTFCDVAVGGAEQVASLEAEALFLCYSDDGAPVDSDEDSIDADEALSMECLRRYRGDTVVLAGETLVSGGCLSLLLAPWGRSFDSGFQVALAASFHCVLVAPLPRWPISTDAISLWRRTRVCPIVFESGGGQGEEEDHWADVPLEERLEWSAAAPSVRHLLRR